MLFPAMKPNDNTAAAGGSSSGPKAATQEKSKIYTSEANQCLPSIVANFAGSQIELVKDAKKLTADLSKKNPALTFPCLETESGQLITEQSAVVSHLARMNPGSGLLGSSPFQEAQVNSWVDWATCAQPHVQSMVDILTGKNAKFETAEYTATLNKVKAETIALNAALNGKKFLVGDKVTLADLVCAWTLMPAF